MPSTTSRGCTRTGAAAWRPTPPRPSNGIARPPEWGGRAIRSPSAAAEAGGSWSAAKLGVLLSNGWENRPADFAAAVPWLERGVARGERFAKRRLAKILEFGEPGVAADPVRAAALFLEEAEAGNAWAASRLGRMYESGRGVGTNDAERVRWTRIGAEGGNADACLAYGWCIESGIGGLPVDCAEAAGWYRKAADAGVVQAQYNLANFLSEGRPGVPVEPAEAVALFRKAAAGGRAWAYWKLWRMRDGGVAPDAFPETDAEADAWLRRAAAGGVPPAIEAWPRIHPDEPVPSTP